MQNLCNTTCFYPPFPCEDNSVHPIPWSTPESAELQNLSNVYEDEPGMIVSAQGINSIIKWELEMNPGLTRENIILTGYSEGAVMSLLLGLSSSVKFGGLGIFAGYLPLRSIIHRVSLTIECTSTANFNRQLVERTHA